MKPSTEISHLLDHLFRHESGKLVAVITRIFGPENLDLAEDVVQDSLVEALSNWQHNGIPENPTAWLFKVAKNKALNALGREKSKRHYASDVVHYLESKWTLDPALNFIFSEQEIVDDQLRMIFTCCHPAISSESQIALSLKTLCGFTISEIARAFLTTNETIHKRLVRARQKIRESKIQFEIPAGHGLEKRLDTVLETIYLMFNEGYSASSGQDLIRYDICEETIRLTEIISNHSAIQNKSKVYALLALMQLNVSRFNARQDAHGNILTLEQQDRRRWNYALIQRGLTNLERSALSGEISSYHILGSISSYYCSSSSYESIDWQSILELYDRLVQIDNSSVVRLNRTIVLSKVHGAEKALDELEVISQEVSLQSYHLLYSTWASFCIELNKFEKAVPILEKAMELAALEPEKALILKKIKFCREKALNLN